MRQENDCSRTTRYGKESSRSSLSAASPKDYISQPWDALTGEFGFMEPKVVFPILKYSVALFLAPVNFCYLVHLNLVKPDLRTQLYCPNLDLNSVGLMVSSLANARAKFEGFVYPRLVAISAID